MNGFTITAAEIADPNSPYYGIDTDALVYALGFEYDQQSNSYVYNGDWDDDDGNGIPDFLQDFFGLGVSMNPSQMQIGG